jgi:hypothetical protein
MSSFVNGGAARASATETTSKQLFVRMNGPVGQQLPPLQVLRVFFQKFGRVVKITSAKNGTIAFVTFATPEQAKAAKNAMNDQEVVDESNGVSLVRTLFVDFAFERGTKPVHEQAPRPVPRQAPVEAPRPTPRPAYVEAPRPEPAPRPAPPQKPVLDVESANLPMVYLFSDQRPKMMSNQAMAFLFDLGLSPQPKFQGDTDVQIFGNGIQWVIPHPDHPYATQDCQRAYDSGHFFTQFPVKIPRDVLKSKKFWRD